MIEQLETEKESAPKVIRLQEEQIRSIIRMIKEAVETISKSWENIKQVQLEKINASWAALEAKKYTDKVLEEDIRMKRIIEALKLLARTYEKVITKGQETTDQATRVIDTIL